MRLFAIIMIVISLFSSCSRSSGEETGFSIVAADFPSYDAARAVLGGTSGLTMLLPPGMESHSYDPTPRDMVRLSGCDLVVYAGGPSDEWVRTILSSLEDPPSSFALTDQVELLSEERREGMEAEEHDHDHDHAAHDIDEHVWTSPVNEIAIVRNLAALISSLDPDNADNYMANADAYTEAISDIDRRIRETVENAERNTLIFASRFPLLYFVREYGLDYYAAFPGCAEETEPSARTVAFLIDKARELDVPCTLSIEMSSPLIAEVIADEAGCGVRVFYTMHNVTAADFMSGRNYIDFMEENIDVLSEALN